MNTSATLYLLPCLIAENTYLQALPDYNRTVIQTIDYFFVEELRTARRFLSAYKIQKPIESLTFFELNKDTKPHEVEAYFRQIPVGVNIGVLSEAGCPGVADPGALAAKQAHKMGIAVKPLVGPSSILLALMASGLSGQSFTFHGYLPIERPDRIAAIKKLEADAVATKTTQIFMETPYRNNGVWGDLVAHCLPDTWLCVASNVMGVDEYIVTQKVSDWKNKTLDLHKKPTIFLMGV